MKETFTIYIERVTTARTVAVFETRQRHEVIAREYGEKLIADDTDLRISRIEVRSPCPSY
jgi:hypothetical protein